MCCLGSIGTCLYFSFAPSLSFLKPSVNNGSALPAIFAEANIAKNFILAVTFQPLAKLLRIVVEHLSCLIRISI